MTRHRNPKGEMPFLDHLEELRWRIFWSLLAIAVGSIVGFALVYYFDLLEVLVAPVRTARQDPDFRLIYLSPADPFMIKLKLGIFVGIILAFPVIVGGVAMGYFAALPVTLEFFKHFEGESLASQLEVGKTLAMVTKLLLAFGVVFELPVVVMVLTALGLVTPEFLRSKRRHAAVAMTVLASLITPGDVITLTVLMMVPLILLYELSIFLSAGITRRRRMREEEMERHRTIGPPEGTVEAG
jgi:sec-independent protein translocase protein TatC